MFKEITAVFKVTEDTAFKDGRWNKDRGDFIFEVKRFRSGATAYGDHSGHSVEIVNHPDAFMHHFDTRYAQIHTQKDKWIQYWKNWIQDEYSLKVDLNNYQEKMVEEKED